MESVLTDKHTAGPWYFGNMPGWGDICILRRPASEYGPTGVIGDAPLAIAVERSTHWQEGYPVEANARLMSAAPDLLTALCKLLGLNHTQGVTEEEYEAAEHEAEVAIGKATGIAP